MVTCPNYVPMFRKTLIFDLGFFGFSYLYYVAPSLGNLLQTTILTEGLKKCLHVINFLLRLIILVFI